MAMKDKAKNGSQISKGKLKKAIGKKVGNRELEVEGSVDQIKGNLKQAAEHVKNAFKN
jgi:uncharacterized protein YjbJ (UPF0337 family)